MVLLFVWEMTESFWGYGRGSVVISATSPCIIYRAGTLLNGLTGFFSRICQTWSAVRASLTLKEVENL